MNGAARSTNDSLVNVGIGLLIAAFATLGLLRLAATLAAWVGGLPQPTGGLTAALSAFANPLHPGAALNLVRRVGATGLEPVTSAL